LSIKFTLYFSALSHNYRLNALFSRRPHSIFWKHQFQSWNTYIFCSFKSRKHRISLFLCNIWCGRKKS